MTLISSGRVDEAKRMENGVQEERFVRIRAIAKELGDEAKEDADRQLTANTLTTQWSIRLFILVGAIAFALGALMAFFMNRVIAKPMNELNEIGEIDRVRCPESGASDPW